ncbi:hypothetical protein [Novosphingobium sp. BW1]|uniref:hypothetical protein n=1 Tax=Novosphingobium sp. BW1 TaxID=2592621 RepID=UPI0011DE73EC|nr:hypothetical protein [Novosphingobium sp. BW1]TYC90975.1 hypothetical protein FMM79_06925 [Novosphingobium sp. BW1]
MIFRTSPMAPTALLAALAALGLAACSPEPAKDYTTDVEDKSGGELIVTDVDETGVDVKVPDTPMTNVPPEDKAGN